MMDYSTKNILFSSISSTCGTFYTDFPGHRHAKNCYELHYVISGRGKVITSDQSFLLYKNTIYVTGPNVYHMQQTNKDNHMVEYCIYFEADGATHDFFMNIFLNENFWIGKGNTHLKNLFQSANDLINSKSLLQNRQAELYIQLILCELAALYKPQIRSLTVPSEKKINNATVTIDWFFLYNQGDITLPALSDLLGLGTRQTERLLKERYNKTFQQMKNEARLEQIKLLLHSPDNLISFIADQCGFYSSSALCSFFKKQTGMTTEEYRKKKHVYHDQLTK